DRAQDTDGGTQPKVRLVKQGLIAGKANAAAPGLDVFGAQVVQFLRQHRLEAASARGKVAKQGHEVNVAVAPCTFLECGGATPLWIFCRQSRTPEPTAVNFSANTREPNNPKRCPTTALQNGVSGLAIELLHQFGDQSRIVLCNEVIDPCLRDAQLLHGRRGGSPGAVPLFALARVQLGPQLRQPLVL